METKRFILRDLLTVTTGRLLTKPLGPDDNGISAIYELLGWMTNDEPFTHQLKRFADECKPWLLRWFPELATVEADIHAACDGLATIPSDDRNAFLEGFVWGLGERLGRHEYDVPRIPRDDHEHKDPYDELVAMRGTDEGITVVAMPAGPGGEQCHKST